MRHLILIISLSFSSNTIAQSFSEFKYLGDPYADELYLGISFSSSRLANNKAPKSENHRESAISGKVDMIYYSYEPGELHYYFQYKLLGDLVALADETINDDPNAILRDEGSSLSNGLLGWHSFGWNIIGRKRVCVALGFNVNDYFTGSTYYTDTTSNKWVSPEPQGYYFGTGPALFADMVVSRFILIHFHGAYSLPYWRPISLSYATVDEGYPMPHFGSISTEIQSPWGLFAGIDYNWLINRGNIPNSTARLDLLLGFRFVL